MIAFRGLVLALAAATCGCSALSGYLASPEVSETVGATVTQAASGNLVGAITTFISGLGAAAVVVYARNKMRTKGATLGKPF